MTYALVDNATLTAVQRIQGDIIIKNTDTIDGDLVAFENFIQGILFYDELICLDNYKKEHQQERKDTFDFIRFLDPTKYNLQQIDSAARQEANHIKPEIRAGKFADEDFKSFLELVKMNSICVWEQSSSIFYLTMRMLGEKYSDEWAKYGQLSATIFNELSDVSKTKGRWSEDVKLINSKGEVLSNETFQSNTNDYGGTNRSLDMFIASLNWLAYKSIYYSMAAKALNADSFLHPIRHAFQIHWMTKTGAFGHGFTKNLLDKMSGDVSNTLAEIKNYGGVATTAIQVPIFTAWLVSETGSPKNIIDAARELKNQSHFTEIRGILREIRTEYDRSNLKESNKKISKWNTDLEKALGDLKRLYGVKTNQGIASSLVINVYNSLAMVSQTPKAPVFNNFTIPRPDFMKSSLNKSFTHTFKNIASELTTTERLGGFKDYLTSAVKLDKYHTSSRFKVEEPKYQRLSSNWKRPM
ncbi:hypothetical protein EYS14_00185 [Alteromonadaceae bacterium M269]|nr:hypothetical protein EYS14_00185 [Alteromonadaceae bacterium M269]